MNKYLLPFCLGGLIIVSLAHFANSSSPMIASIIYALPTLFLSSAFFISDEEKLIKFSFHGSLMLFSSIAYAVSYGFLLKYYSKTTTTFLAFIPWCVVVIIIQKLLI
jgi:hypothetical protein